MASRFRNNTFKAHRYHKITESVEKTGLFYFFPNFTQVEITICNFTDNIHFVFLQLNGEYRLCILKVILFVGINYIFCILIFLELISASDCSNRLTSIEISDCDKMCRPKNFDVTDLGRCFTNVDCGQRAIPGRNQFPGSVNRFVFCE